ncbi:MAG TPA: tape measure protein [Niabella sp.]|nr:tape measure protein [Niabella sp.]
MAGVVKIYELRTLGYSDIKKELSDVAKQFDTIRKAKQAAEKGLYTSTDVADIKKYADEVGKLKIQEQELRTQRQQMMNEMKAINLERQKELAAAREQAKQNKIVAGSYADIYKQYRELYNLSKNAIQGQTFDFRGQILNYDQLIAKTKELAAAEQSFRRQFTRDNLLVGEYSSGIVQAFKQNGLDDLIKGQITKAKQALQSLDTQFDGLKQDLSDVKVRGDGAFESIEKKMIENRKEAANLSTQLTKMQADFRGAGSIGNQISESIGKGFKNLKGQIGSLMVQYIGLTALFSGISSGVSRAQDEAVALDSLEAALKAVSVTTEEYATNQAFLNRVTDQYGVALIDTKKTFKNFYASSTLAGISAEETRKIYESVIDATSVLKLSQEDTNGVLLAFGQIASKGKVQAEELRGQIGERLPGAYSIAAKAMGVTQQELNKMLETGKVLSSDFLPKFAAELTKTFTNGGAEVESLSATINRNKNVFTQYLDANSERVGAAITNITKLSAALTTLAAFIFGLPFPVLIAGISTMILLSNTWLGAKLRLIAAWALERSAMVIEVAQLAINNGVRAASTALITVHTSVLALSARTTGVAAVATRVLAGALALLATPIGVVIGALGALSLVFVAIKSNAKGATDATKDLAKETRETAAQQQINVDLSKKVASATENQVARIKTLTAVVASQVTTEKTKLDAYNKLLTISDSYRSALKKEGLDISEVTRLSNNLIVSLQNQAKAKAFADLTREKEKEKISIETELAGLPSTDINKETGAGAFFQNIGSAIGIGKGTSGQQKRELNNRLANVDSYLKGLYGMAEKNKDLQNALISDVAPETDFSSGGSGGKTGQQKDRIKEIEALRDQELAVNETAFISLAKTEEQYLNRSKEINDKAIDDKITFLNQSKTLNAEELKEVAQLKLEKTKLEKETNDKIFEIRSKALTDKFEADKKLAEDKADQIVNDPSVNTTQTERTQAQLDADRQILALQTKFNADMDALEKDRNNLTVKNAENRKDALSNINQAITKDEADLIKSNIEDTKRAGENAIAEFNLVLDRAAALIQADNRLSQSQKNRNLQQLEREREYGLLVREAANYQALEIEFKRAYEAGLITLREYEEIVRKIQELQGKIASDPKNTNFSLREAIRGQSVGQDLGTTLSNVADKFGGSLEGKNILGEKVSQEQAGEYAKAFSKVIADSYATAQYVMQSYFDTEARNIQNSLSLQLERMKVEEEQVKSRAKSTAEMEAIERKYNSKRKAAEQAAFEKTKELKKKEAKISLATELAGIWASVWSIGNPIAAAILGAVMSGLALVRYGMRVSEINSQKYEFGGSPDDVPKRGGKFGGNPHSRGGTPFVYKGNQFEAEVDELAIVRTKNADKSKRYTISGNHSEIASMLNQLGGGVAFRPGAKLRKFEYGGDLGQSLQAPVMPSQIINYNSPSNVITQFENVVNAIDKKTDAINDRIDRLEVVQKTSTVTTAQAKEVKQTSIGNL